MSAKRIGILTGGGDVPGLNSVIKSVVYRGAEIGYEVIGIRRGWEGLTHVDLKDPASRSRYILPLNRENTRTIDRTGGTYLHTSRTNPTKMRKLPPALAGQHFSSKESTKNGVTSTVFDVTPAVLKNIEALGLDYVVAIGGDDTLSYAAELDRHGVKVIAVPKTMDNDVRNTEYCIGFSTAITRAMEAIERQRTTVGSHERIGVFRVFGRDAGYTALYTAYVTSVRCCIPEYKVNLEHLIEILVTDKRNNPSNYSLVILSEGAEWEGYTVKEYGPADAFGHRKKMSVAEDLSDEIKAATGERDRRQRPDLRFALRQSGLRRPHGGQHLRRNGDGRSGRWKGRPDDGDQQRLLRDGADSRSQTRTAQSGDRHDVQHGALPPKLRSQAGPADFPHASLGPASEMRLQKRATEARISQRHGHLPCTLGAGKPKLIRFIYDSGLEPVS